MAMRKMKPATLRMLVSLSILFIAGCAYALHLGLGTPSAVGVGQFFLLCPLGGLEALLASKTFLPQAVISLVIVIIIALLFGRTWCAWGCPAQVVRGLFGQKQPAAEHAACAKSIVQTIKQDSRLWVLAGALIAVLVVGFPVFCLVCPIGLTFGTVFSVISALQSAEVSWGLVIFPAALVLELVVMKKWCIHLCPVAALLSLFGRFAKPLRPVVQSETCLQSKGDACSACKTACPEGIDLHCEDADAQLADCTRCAECLHVCPSHSISMPLFVKKDISAADESTTEKVD